jgi:hypothetical protein
VLPIIIGAANYFAMKYIDRTSEFMGIHKNRARELLGSYAPELRSLNDGVVWKERGYWGSIRNLQKAIHAMVMLTALVPLALFLYQLWFLPSP